MPVKVSLTKILPHINIPGVRVLAKSLFEAGHTQDEIVEQVVAFVDASIDWTLIGPWGSLIEAVDGPVATALVKAILHIKPHQ